MPRKCPVDNADLKSVQRDEVEIDECPQCRGVWLDRGELEKIIERSQGQEEEQEPGGVRGFLSDLFG